MTQEKNIYKVIADYRPNNPKNPHYYVAANSINEAKTKFQNKITWLKIYSCVEVDDMMELDQVLSDPDYYVLC